MVVSDKNIPEDEKHEEEFDLKEEDKNNEVDLLDIMPAIKD